jgi:PAS domain S-box-containing protein
VQPKGIDHTLLDHLKVAVSIISWQPESPFKMDWILINDSRCRLTGFTREEILQTQPFGQISRETRGHIELINEEIAKNGQFNVESTLLHKNNQAIPVAIHLKIIEVDGQPALLAEFQDIRSYKETEAMLKLARESSAEMLTLIEKEKQNITKNITNNLSLVLIPLMDQLRVSATDHQKEILNLMAKRIEDVSKDIGIVDQMESLGANLTRRQILICEMIRDGMTSKEIALVLGCSPSTINNHRNIIRRKLKLSGKAANLQTFLNKMEVG